MILALAQHDEQLLIELGATITIAIIGILAFAVVSAFLNKPPSGRL